MHRFSLRMLIARLETMSREEAWRIYTANVQLGILRMLSSEAAKIKPFSDVLNGNAMPNDNRTAEEITMDIYNKLIGGEVN